VEIAGAVRGAFSANGFNAAAFAAAVPVLAASAACVIFYLCSKRNSLIAIFGSTILYMLLARVL
jgi:branched-subunit amino acid transport protein AzlD